MFDAYKRFFRFSGTEKSTWYKGMAFELLRSIFEALQFVALFNSDVIESYTFNSIPNHVDVAAIHLK